MHPYRQVFVQDFGGFMGNYGFSTITENMVDDKPTHDEFFYLWDITEGEALAQQWFGNLLSCRDWDHFWLNKAFAHYLSGRYNAYKNGLPEFLLFQQWYDLNTLYLNDWSNGLRRPLVSSRYDDLMSWCSDNYPAARGAMVLRMLEAELGEENWKKTLRYFLQKHAHGTVSTGDLEAAVKASCGLSMGWFFDQWVYGMGHPVFEVKEEYNPKNNVLTLEILQTQQRDSSSRYPQSKYFKGKMTVETDGIIHEIQLKAKAKNRFSFPCSRAPKLVHVDVGGIWIKEIKHEKSLEALRHQLLEDKDSWGKRWAMQALVNRAQQQGCPAAEKAFVCEALRNVVSGGDYWRLRYLALTQWQALVAPTSGKEAVNLDENTRALLLECIKREKAWNKAAAVHFLGATHDPQYALLYQALLKDEADRVVNAAAIALGKSKSPDAYEALVSLVNRPSWKNQSLISALYGLKALGDPRGNTQAFAALSDAGMPHWTLATPVWDYQLIAAETIAALGKSNEAYPQLAKVFHKSLEENDIHGTFYTLTLLYALGDPAMTELMAPLKEKFKGNKEVLQTVQYWEERVKGMEAKP